VHQDGQLVSRIKQHIESAVGELKQFDRWSGLIPILLGSDVYDRLPQRVLRWLASGPAAFGQSTQVGFRARPDLQRVGEGLIDTSDQGSASRA
jgi:hypothetical protein